MATETPAQPRSAAKTAAEVAAAAQAASAARSGAAAVVPNLPGAAARAAAAAAIIAALGAFLSRRRARARAWLTVELSKRSVARAGTALPDSTIADLIALEEKREEVFAQKSAIRMARDLPLALAIPDAAQREHATAMLLRREQQYARQRSEAMAARAFAAVDRVVLRGQSPQGAFWRLDPTVTEHTAGCLLMGGKFWPWVVLDRVHPPRHHGCPCRLLGYGEAIADGLMRAGDVQDVRQAVRAAVGIVMEGVLLPGEWDDVQGLLVEAYGSMEVVQLRQTLIEQGMTTGELFDAQVFA